MIGSPDGSIFKRCILLLGLGRSMGHAWVQLIPLSWESERCIHPACQPDIEPQCTRKISAVTSCDYTRQPRSDQQEIE
eukprot:scaffold74680_cov22-Prasinocladus_malaysianus.AAC.1